MKVPTDPVFLCACLNLVRHLILLFLRHSAATNEDVLTSRDGLILCLQLLKANS